jgi:hypothetical protein
MGNPQKGDILTKTFAHSGFEFIIVKPLRLIPRTMDSAIDVEGSKYGMDYMIQY